MRGTLWFIGLNLLHGFATVLANPSDTDGLSDKLWKGDLKAIERMLDEGLSPDFTITEDTGEFGNRTIPVFNRAVAAGNIDIVRLLLARGAKIDLRDNIEGFQPIYHAATKNSIPLVRLLLEKGADPNTETSEWDGGPWQPIFFAAANGNTEMINLLIEHGAKLTERSRAVEGAVQSGNLDLVRFFLSKGGSLEWKIPEGTLLHAACYSAPLEMVKFLVEHGADITAKNPQGEQPLHLAASSGNLAAVSYLLEKGADANASVVSEKDQYYHNKWRPLHFSANPQLDDPSGDAARVYQDITRLLISKGADVNAIDSEGNTPLHLVSCEEVARVLVEKGAKVDTPNLQEEQPIHRAAVKGDVAIIRLLLEHGAGLSPKDHEGRTPLDVAAFWSKTEAMTFFLAKGVKPTDQTLISSLYFGELGNLPLLRKYGAKITAAVFLASNRAQDRLLPHLDRETVAELSGTLLPQAVESGDLASVEKLINAGAVIDARVPPDDCCEDDEFKGAQAIHFASTRDDSAILDLLLKHGAKPDAATDNGSRPLHIAAGLGNLALVKNLIAAGADFSLKDSQGKTAADLAKEAGHSEIVKLLAGRKN